MPPKRGGRAKPRFVHLQGGSKRRAVENDEDADEAVSEAFGVPHLPTSALFIVLVSLWSLGVLSPQLCQKNAHAANEDMHTLTDHNRIRVQKGGSCVFFEKITDMGKIGSEGKNPSHCYRDLMILLPDLSFNVPNMTWLPFKSSVAPFYEYLEQEIMWPHVMFSQLYHFHKELFNQVICPGADAIRDFWQQMSRNPQLQHPSFAARPEYKERGIPIRFHGDGVPTTGIAKS